MNIEQANLNLTDKLILLALDDNKGTFVSESLSFGYAIAGAVIFELSIDGSIEILQQKIKVVKREPLTDKLLDNCLTIINQSKNERTTQDWIQLLGNKEGLMKSISIEKLISLKILTKKEDKFLWIFSNDKYPTKNASLENKLRNRLHDIVENNKEPELIEIMLISLVDSCELNKEIYGNVIAQEKKKRIKEVIKSIQLASSTNEIIKEIHDSIVAAIIIIIAASTITSTINT